MSRKLALPLLLFMLGLASWDALLPHQDHSQADVEVRVFEDGVIPPKPH